MRLFGHSSFREAPVMQTEVQVAQSAAGTERKHLAFYETPPASA
jgi:hypothetical protein